MLLFFHEFKVFFRGGEEGGAGGAAGASLGACKRGARVEGRLAPRAREGRDGRNKRKSVAPTSGDGRRKGVGRGAGGAVPEQQQRGPPGAQVLAWHLQQGEGGAREGGEEKGLPAHAIQLVPTTDREAVRELCRMTDSLDLIIPRGGESLINAVIEMALVPVIKHYKGICHTYIDASADLEMAWAIAENAKCQRPGVCNAMETLLVHKEIAADFLPKMGALFHAQNVKLLGDSTCCQQIPSAQPASEEDWYKEYLDLTLSIRVVDHIESAIEHINHYGSGHSDAIVTQDDTSEKQFLAEVDSSSVYVNASTRFTDGAEFGMGAEIGISTDKLHARGPMGLEELTTYKFVIEGTGQIRE